MRIPPIEPLHKERTFTPTLPIETMAKSSTKPTETIPQVTMGSGGDSERLFTLKSLEAPRKFFGKGQPDVSTQLIEMTCWAWLSKVPKSDLWDVVATCMIGGVLTWMNAKLHTMKELGVTSWPTGQAFVVVHCI